jgi:hypothetical protein
MKTDDLKLIYVTDKLDEYSVGDIADKKEKAEKYVSDFKNDHRGAYVSIIIVSTLMCLMLFSGFLKTASNTSRLIQL